MKKQNINAQVQSKPFDFVLFITVLVLLAMGIIMVLSASSPQALSESGNSYSYVTRQAVFAVLRNRINAIYFKNRLSYIFKICSYCIHRSEERRVGKECRL